MAQPQASLSIWDLVLYDAARRQPNLTLLLNTSCLDAAMDGARLVSVTGWQLSTQTWHLVQAAYFADCSGDAILAPLTGAEERTGREARSQYGESIAPETADDLTMGMSYIYYTREHDRPMPFEPFEWARRIDACDELPRPTSTPMPGIPSPYATALPARRGTPHMHGYPRRDKPSPIALTTTSGSIPSP